MKGRITEKKLLGLMFCSMGAGMLIVIIIPGWGFVIAALLVAAGFLLCNSRC